MIMKLEKKSQLKLMTIIGLFALVGGVAGSITESQQQKQQEQQQQQQPHQQQQQQLLQQHQQRQQQLPSTRSHIRLTNRSGMSKVAPPLPTHAPNCEYKELMTNLHDRVGILATLDEDQRHRLEVIDKKIDTLVDSNTARMESLKAQQTDFQQRLNSFEHIQRLSRHTLDELKGETDEVLGSRLIRQLKHKKRNRHNLNDLSRPIRQAGNERNQTNISLSVPDRLDALASLLTSTAYNVKDLQQGLKKLLQSNSQIRRNLAHLKGIPNMISVPLPEPSTSCFDAVLAVNGILKIQLTPQSESFYVPCDQEWTVIMNRGKDEISFERSWADYKDGFGNLAGDFFIGLDKLHALTSSVLHELRIVLEDFQGNVAYASYTSFAIGSEKEAYPLSVLGEFRNDLQPSAGDSFSYQAGAKFSTIDYDNDNCVDCNCALKHKGAGWFKNCATSNLFGTYFINGNANAGETGIFWEQFQGLDYSLRKVRMLIRPIFQEGGARR